MRKIFLISIPRARSVCAFRTLDQAGRFDCFHEPFVSVHSKKFYPALTKDWFRDSAYQSSKEIFHEIETSSRDVLVKDMSFAIFEHIQELSKLSNASFVLLYRYPRDSLISLYHKCVGIQIEPEIHSLRNLCGFNQIYQSYHKLKLDGKDVSLVNMDSLNSCLPEIFHKLKIPFDESYLTWKKENYLGIRWKESKKCEHFIYWHGEAVLQDGVNLHAKSHSFDEIKDKKHLKIMLQLFGECLYVYQQLEDLSKTVLYL